MAQVRFDGHDDHGLPDYVPVCRERRVLDIGATWVHGYTMADVSLWKFESRQMYIEHTGRVIEPDDDAPPKYVDLAQAIHVCRTGPGEQSRTFVVTTGGRRQAVEQLIERLPGQWVRAVCRESDSLALDGYLPPEKTNRPEVALAKERLGQQLNDRRFWAALNYLSLKVMGVSLRENRRPAGEVLTLLRQDVEAQEKLIEFLGPLGAMVGQV